MSAVGNSSPAGFWKRYVAYGIDTLLLSLLLLPLYRVFFPDWGMGEIAHLQAMAAHSDIDPMLQQRVAILHAGMNLLTRMTLWFMLAWLLVGGAWFVLFESSSWQATPGKRLLGIRVTDLDGARIDPRRALARFVAAGLSWATLNLGHALAAWAPECRALHDYLAGTRVVNVDPGRPQMPWWGWALVAAQALALLALMVSMVVASLDSIAAANAV